MIKAPSSILIVDQEQDSRSALADCLMERGYNVATTSPGDEARSLLARQHFDILLADVGEDGDEGLPLLQQAKAADPDLAVIMMAAYGSIMNAVACMKSGAYDYLLKPITPDELCGRLQEVLAQQAFPPVAHSGQAYPSGNQFKSMIAQSASMQRVFQMI